MTELYSDEQVGTAQSSSASSISFLDHVKQRERGGVTPSTRLRRIPERTAHSSRPRDDPSPSGGERADFEWHPSPEGAAAVGSE